MYLPSILPPGEGTWIPPALVQADQESVPMFFSSKALYQEDMIGSINWLINYLWITQRKRVVIELILSVPVFTKALLFVWWIYAKMSMLLDTIGM
jgi:hypothetical protein